MAVLLPGYQDIQKKITKNPQIVFVKSTNTPRYTQIPTNTHDREEIGPSVIYQNDRLATTIQDIKKIIKNPQIVFVKSTNTPKYTKYPQIHKIKRRLAQVSYIKITALLPRSRISKKNHKKSTNRICRIHKYTPNTPKYPQIHMIYPILFV